LHLLIAFDDQVRLNVVYRTQNFIAFAGDELSVETHTLRSADYLSTVVSIITKTYKIDHLLPHY